MASVLEFGAAGSIVQTEMTNADKTIWENVREETADELHGGEGHRFFCAFVAIIKILESDSIFSNGDNAMIRDGNAEDVATEIFDQFLFVIERGLDIDFPIFGQGFRQHPLNVESVVVGVEFAVYPELREGKAKAVAELIGKQFDWEEEFMVSGIPFVASGRGDQRATGDDEMEVEMLLHGLTPSMHDH